MMTNNGNTCNCTYTNIARSPPSPLLLQEELYSFFVSSAVDDRLDPFKGKSTMNKHQFMEVLLNTSFYCSVIDHFLIRKSQTTTMYNTLNNGLLKEVIYNTTTMYNTLNNGLLKEVIYNTTTMYTTLNHGLLKEIIYKTYINLHKFLYKYYKTNLIYK